ncbi:P1 family peptidase [Wukongibacter sp. M2B1]|uniref:DmpA family aminopeptidase n=1 Tax=Wukongibacter sp. M2B1 TaxID=3088895 RepID=UPI003D7B1C32
MNKRIRDYGINIGRLPTGELNSITDVKGVRVGHITLNAGNIKTGVTAIIPCCDNIFQNKLLCGLDIINGFGKSVGLVQIDELGTLETPIVLTNTLSVGDASKGLIQYMLSNNPDIGISTGTVNPVVCECNDGYLNDIRGFHITPSHVFDAISAASHSFKEGSVGAGTGMSAYKLKGGIGTASRSITLCGEKYIVGGLVLTNMGKKHELVIDGNKVGKKLLELDPTENELPDKGSIIMIIATDIPLSSRQLKRASRRCIAGLSRTGSSISNGSGEIAISFSTANRTPHYPQGILAMKFISDEFIDPVFEATAEVIEEAILNSMITAETVIGINGNVRYTLAKYISELLD